MGNHRCGCLLSAYNIEMFTTPYCEDASFRVTFSFVFIKNSLLYVDSAKKYFVVNYIIACFYIIRGVFCIKYLFVRTAVIAVRFIGYPVPVCRAIVLDHPQRHIIL